MKIRLSLDTQILKSYAIGTTALFLALASYYLLGFNGTGLSSSVHLSTVQAFSLTLFMLVLISSIVGMAFHQLVSTERKARDTFAFIFSMSILKLVGSMIFFELYF